MGNPLERFAFLSLEDTKVPYLPYPVAVEAGVLVNPEDKAKPLKDPAGVTLANGYLPNAREAGLVALGDEIIAFDLVALDFESKQIRVGSAPKSRVANDGEILAVGAVVMFNTQLLKLRFAGVAIDRYKRPWEADRLRVHRSYLSAVGRISVFNTGALEIPDHEVTGIDLETNSVTAKPRLRYF